MRNLIELSYIVKTAKRDIASGREYYPHKINNIQMRLILISLLIFFNLQFAFAEKGQNEIIFCGNAENDLYKVLKFEGFKVKLFDSANNAIKSAERGMAVFIVATGYPKVKTEINPGMLQLAKKKKLRLYVEYPAMLPGVKVSDSIMKSSFERGVITSTVFGRRLEPLSIVGINDCHIIPAEIDSPMIVLAKVAGFDKAVYGLNDVKKYPVLFRHDNMMIAMTKLSNFASGRFAPSSSWKEVWKYILEWMTGKRNLVSNNWLSYLEPSFKQNQPLPKNAGSDAVKRGVNWFFNAHLLVDSSWKDEWLKYQGNGLNPIGPPVKRNAKTGNGTLGIIEGPTSKINFDGTQDYRYWVRADDQGEAAYALAAASTLSDKKRNQKVASNLIDYVFENSNLRGGDKSDTSSPVFGLIGWAVTHPNVFYGDDNARFILGVIGTSAFINTGKWDKKILENIIANFRTTGVKGFRGDRLEEKDIINNGWKFYWKGNKENPHPHFESWLWACYLWLYDKTGYEPLLKRTEEAIRITMRAYPDKWRWTNGIQQERARMMLPLAWLIRVSDTKEHRQWLDLIVSDLLTFQQTNGAIREELGKSEIGLFGPPKSNKEYGTTEAPLIFENGDPVADMLYTNNFAFFGLNEAYHATKDVKYFKALKKLSDFLIRIQVKSKKFQDLDGAWFRAFNYELWDYWASNGDAGWGAWATLTGWIQSWIVSTQVLVEQHESYWNLTRNSKIDRYMDQTINLMLPLTN